MCRTFLKLEINIKPKINSLRSIRSRKDGTLVAIMMDWNFQSHYTSHPELTKLMHIPRCESVERVGP